MTMVDNFEMIKLSWRGSMPLSLHILRNEFDEVPNSYPKTANAEVYEFYFLIIRDKIRRSQLIL